MSEQSSTITTTGCYALFFEGHEATMPRLAAEALCYVVVVDFWEDSCTTGRSSND
jgi:hypothetical protein